MRVSAGVTRGVPGVCLLALCALAAKGVPSAAPVGWRTLADEQRDAAATETFLREIMREYDVLRGSKILAVDPVLRAVLGEYEQVGFSFFKR